MKSALQIARAAYQPKLPIALRGALKAVEGEPTQSVADQEEVQKLFPNTYGMPYLKFEPTDEAMANAQMNVGVILSGGQAPGGHNVISGLFDGIKKLNPENKLYGFLLGPGGLVDHKYMELTADIIDEYRNTGGFDIIGSGRTKLEKKAQFDKGLEILQALDIKALVIIGGDDSNTNACVLAEYYAQIGAGVQVIGNIMRDCNSAKKYWHFVKLMGRSASHVTLECALQTHPNITLIGEEVEAKNQTLDDVVTYIAEAVCDRANLGMNYGVVLVPEGLIEFIPAIKKLIAELNDMLAANQADFDLVSDDHKIDYVLAHLSDENAAIFRSLPLSVSRQLALERDPHGNVQVSLIETEQLLAEMVAKKLADWKKDGIYTGKFATQHHFFGYEGRCAAPSNWDADYCYSLGFNASMLIAAGKTGYMSSIKNTFKPVDEWVAGGIPITMMMNMEKRNGEMKPVIRKALVELGGKPYKYFVRHRTEWARNTDFVYPGPIQYFGPSEVCDRPTLTLTLEQE